MVREVREIFQQEARVISIYDSSIIVQFEDTDSRHHVAVSSARPHFSSFVTSFFNGATKALVVVK